MQKFEFRVLCADRHESCGRVKKIMEEDFDIRTVDVSKTYDHIGTIELPDADAALAKLEKLEAKVGNTIRNIEIAAV